MHSARDPEGRMTAVKTAAQERKVLETCRKSHTVIVEYYQ
jgi:hypothetical protein